MELKKSFTPKIIFYHEHCIIDVNDILYFYFYHKNDSLIDTFQINDIRNGKFETTRIKLHNVIDYTETGHFFPLIYLYCYGT